MKKPLRMTCALLLGCAAATSCSTAGPFVTSISSDGQGNLIIEKSMVKFNPFVGHVSNTKPSTTTIKIMGVQPGSIIIDKMAPDANEPPRR